MKTIIIGCRCRSYDDILLAAARMAAAERCMLLMARQTVVEAERALRKMGKAMQRMQIEPVKIPEPPPEIVDKAPYYNQFRKKSWR